MSDGTEQAIEATRLLEILLQTAASGDHERLTELCVSHAAVIAKHFAEWNECPPSNSGDAEAWETRVGGLYSVAKVFANHLNNPDLLRSLLDAGQPSELALWERKLSEALLLMRSCRFDEAIALLTNQLIDARRLAGHGHLHLSATTHWYLSQCQWMSQKKAKAIAHAERSLQITQRIHDDPKYVSRYFQHLYQVHRYFGDASEAAKYARLSGEFLASTDAEMARFYRTQAKLLEAGEPLTRVVVWVGELRYELDDLPFVKDAQLNLVIERNRIGLQPTERLVQEGRAARDRGEFDEALAIFRQARTIDPYDPEPVIHLAFLFAYAERYVESIECFEEVERLAPGWHSSRTGLWLVQRILAGQYPHEVLLIAMAFGNSSASDPETLTMICQGIERFPNLSFLRLEEARCLRAADKVAEMEAALHRGMKCDGDVDVRTRLLVELAQTTKGDERQAFLREAIELNGNLVAVVVAKLMLRESQHRT